MSHVTIHEADQAENQIKDIDALRRAATRCNDGAVFRENQKHFKAYGDEGSNTGHVVAHAIGLEGAGYEIGVIESKKYPGTFSLAFDNYSGELEPVFGQGLENLLMFYHAEAMRSAAESCGDMYSEEILNDGTIVARMDTTTRMGV